MIYRIAADLLVIVHLLFIAAVLLGGLLVLRWPRLAWIHVPVVAWGFLVEAMGWVCPLTPVEQSLRRMAGQAGYEGGFIDHYLLPLLYPAELTAGMRMGFAGLVVAVNLALYFRLWQKRRVSDAG